jgi:hypothetical protein
MPRKRKISPFYAGMDSEIREALLQLKGERRAGRLKAPPRKESDCHSLEDVCLYVFKSANLDGSYQMLRTDAGIKRWVWFGHDFGDRLVSVVERLAPHIQSKEALEELRLVATSVTKSGIERLRRVFPKARVTVYTDEDDKRNWQLSQAAFSPR